jgi:hypothetical protein
VIVRAAPKAILCPCAACSAAGFHLIVPPALVVARYFSMAKEGRAGV